MMRSMRTIKKQTIKMRMKIAEYLKSLITAFVGIAKEFVWDKWLKKGTFEKKDLLCDLIGIIIGCI